MIDISRALGNITRMRLGMHRTVKHDDSAFFFPWQNTDDKSANRYAVHWNAPASAMSLIQVLLFLEEHPPPQKKNKTFFYFIK